MDNPIDGIELHYCLTPDTAVNENPDQYIWRIYADIVGYDVENSANDQKVGFIGATIFQAGNACNDRESIIIAADSVDQESYDCAEDVYGSSSITRWLQKNLVSWWDDSMNAIYIRNLWIREGFRGHDYGLIAIRQMVRRFGYGCRIAALRPVPLAGDENDLSPMPKGPARKAATKKLERLYSRLGFVPAGRSGVMVADMELAGAMQISPKNQAEPPLLETPE